MTLFSKPNLFSILCISILSLSLIRPSFADDTPGFGSILVEDVKYEATAPSRWESAEWTNLGWATLAVVGTAVIADRPLRDFWCQQSKMSSCPGVGANAEVTNSTLTSIENFGQTYALGVMGGFYLAGITTGNEKSVWVAEDLVAASIISAGIGQAIKVTFNRSRPRDNQGNNDFVGYTGLNNNSSFPSGHSTEAFTLASVIASSYEDEPWVGYTVYSVAGLVGAARMYHDAHWASDVVASAFIGTWVGKSVVSHNKSMHQRGKNKVTIFPDIAPDYTGVRIVSQF